MNQCLVGAGVVFDWDGTLIDSDFLLDLALEIVLSRRSQLTLQEIRPALYQPQRERPLLKTIRLPVAGREEIVREIASEFKRLDDEADLFEGAERLLRDLHQMGIPLAIVTGRRKSSLYSQLVRLGLEQLFSAVISRDEAPAKPDPAGLLMARKLLNVDRILFIGNSMADLQCALTADAEFLGVSLCRRAREPQIQVANVPLRGSFEEIRCALSCHLL